MLSERSPNTGNRATQAQHSGYMRLLTLGTTLHRASDQVTQEQTNSTMASLPGAQTNVPKTFGALESPQDLQARYRHVAEVELHRYVSEAIIPPEQMRNINLTEYWKARQYTYPLLYQIAMDVLPAQASSVSSERVFSSSKRTCTSERNRLSSTNMEFLQVLKHAYYRRRRENEELETLDFVSHLYENLSLSDD